MNPLQILFPVVGIGCGSLVRLDTAGGTGEGKSSLERAFTNSYDRRKEGMATVTHDRLAFVFLSFVILALLLTGSLTGCSVGNLFKPQGPKVAIGKEFAGDRETPRSYVGLQAEVMGFADEYALAIWEAADELLKRTTDPEKRVLIQWRKGSLVNAAMRIAARRNPAANLLDMVVFVTLERIVVKEYWAPEVYGPGAQDLVDVHLRLEKEVWSLAGEVLSPGQLQKLRNMIEEWWAAHPKQYYVLDIRLKGLAELEGQSPGESQEAVNSLLGEVERSVEKVDEALLMGERAMFYFERAPRLMTLQTDLMMDQLSAKPDVRQLMDNVGRLTTSFEGVSQTVQGLPGTLTSERTAVIGQVTGWLDQEHERLVADLKANKPEVKDLVVESRLAMTAGDSLVKSITALDTQLEAERLKSNLPPVDPMKALEKAHDTTRYLQELAATMNTFVTSEEVAVWPMALSKALNEINTQSKSVLDHLFFLAAGLIFLFLAGLVLALLCYRYLAGRLVDSRRASG
jgi:hypothetical protein